MKANNRRSDAFVIVLTAGATTLLAWWTLRLGVAFGPDAWTYWTSSISLLEGRGYVDGHGLPVREWPPLYALWLALVQSCVGVSVAAVRLADAIAIGGMAATLTAWALQRTNPPEDPSTAPRWPVAVVASAGCVAAARGANSEFVMLTMLFAALWSIDGLRNLHGGRRLMQLALCALLLSLMVLTRHAALAFLPGVWWLLRGRAGQSGRAAVACMLALTGTASIAWWSVRWGLEQGGTLSWFTGTHSPTAIAWTMTRAIDRGLGPFPFGILMFALAWMAFGPGQERATRVLRLPSRSLQHADAGAFVATSLGMLVLMFLVVHVADTPSMRFTRFASLITATLLATALRDMPRTRLRWALLTLLILPNTIYCTKHLVRGRRASNTITEHGGESFLPLHAVPGPANTPQTQRPDGKLQVPAPVFTWHRQRLQQAKDHR